MTTTKACEVLRKHSKATVMHLTDYERDVTLTLLHDRIDKLFRGKKEEVVASVLVWLLHDHANFVTSAKSDYHIVREKVELEKKEKV